MKASANSKTRDSIALLKAIAVLAAAITLPGIAVANTPEQKTFEEKLDAVVGSIAHVCIPRTADQEKAESAAVRKRLKELEGEGDVDQTLFKTANIQLQPKGDLVIGLAALSALGHLESVDREIQTALKKRMEELLAKISSKNRGEEASIPYYGTSYVSVALLVLATQHHEYALDLAKNCWETADYGIRMTVIESLRRYSGKEALDILRTQAKQSDIDKSLQWLISEAITEVATALDDSNR